jgi:2-dehydro-3-deoxygluconokinase
MTLDVATLGEAMLRVWTPAGERLSNAESFRVSVGGAESNVAVALRQIGKSASWISRLSTGPLGDRISQEIGRHGVDLSGVTWDDDARTGLYFVELSAAPRPVMVHYDRANSAASKMSTENVDLSIINSAQVFHISGITPALSASCSELSLAAVSHAKASGVKVTIDVNYRSRLWSASDANKTLSKMCEFATLVICTREDAKDVFGITGTSEEVIRELSKKLQVEQMVLTDGAVGAVSLNNGQVKMTPSIKTDTIDRVGAGDAFAAGVISGLLDDDVDLGLSRGVAMAALKRGTYGDQLLTSMKEVEQLIAGSGREVSR